MMWALQPTGRLAISANRRLQRMKTPVVAVQEFVEGEIDAKVQSVGPPLAALEIDHSGKRKWIRWPAVCTRESEAE
jgi:hypothetical protein